MKIGSENSETEKGRKEGILEEMMRWLLDPIEEAIHPCMFLPHGDAPQFCLNTPSPS